MSCSNDSVITDISPFMGDEDNLGSRTEAYIELLEGKSNIGEDLWQTPKAQGLYDPQNEHEACGVGFIVSIDGTPSHKILRDAQIVSERMNHRGACACDNDTGDGAGVKTSIPHNFYSKELVFGGVRLPAAGKYATGIIYCDEKTSSEVEVEFAQLALELNLKVIAWRTVPTNKDAIGVVARKSEPLSRQVFIECPSDLDQEFFDRQIYVLRKRSSHELIKEGRRFYICSLCSKTIVYKGLFTSDQLWEYYTDLKNPDFETYLALVHTRFSTNTFPSWERAHPLRVIAHNGEINTLRGNVNLMKAREGVMQSEIFGDQLTKLYPVVEPNLSDSGSFDCVLEFLTMASDRSLPEAVMTMVPEAWQNDKTMPQEKRDFYQWASCVMEPWDGPALISFTDGRYIGAVLDRNGLRPSRFYVTRENILVMASEVGVYDIDASKIVLKSRLKPGRMLLVDTKEKKFIQDVEIKTHIARSRPHSEWLQQKITIDEIRNANFATASDELKSTNLLRNYPFDPRLLLFGYTTETINMLLVPMFNDKKEALGSMGNDAPLACLSAFQPLLYDYFKQLFAQVTNPPIDPFREKVVMSMQSPIGPEANLLQPSVKQVHRIWLQNPILSIPDTNVLKSNIHRGWKTKVLDLTYEFEKGVRGYVDCIDDICRQGFDAASSGYQLLVISDRNAGRGRVPVSALAALGALHHFLIETLQRMKVGIIVETAEAREVHHICVLLGYGADAICPYLAFELAQALRDDCVINSDVNNKQIYNAYAKAIEMGVAKVMAKMGISTLQSYKSAQIFEAVGIGEELISKCFRGTASRIGGITLETVAKEAIERYNMAFGDRLFDTRILRNPGNYHWRNGGEAHINEPAAIASLQEATLNKNWNSFEAFKSTTLDSVRKCTLRGQLELVTDQNKVDISEVEPASEIVKRFVTGAMSFGSISLEAHQTLAITMNRIGGKSNTGEGGENSERYLGCTMMRKCHLNTCPVGIATQDPVLRQKFTGKPEHVVNFFFMLAEDIRNIMAELGIRRFQDLIGRTDLLQVSRKGSSKSNSLNFSLLLKNALELRPGTNIVGGSIPQDFQLEKRADYKLIQMAQNVLDGVEDNTTIKLLINNEERAFGSTLSYHIACKYGENGLPREKSIDIFLEGSAGQSFCAFLSSGVNVTLKGDANDYVGKGLCGGSVVIMPPDNSTFESHLNVIVGNVCLYGATKGTAYFRGIAAERFCVRNSGATAVVEGVGDHGCEYMTGGIVVILGLTGRNFAAGMSGGIAYIYDTDGSFKNKVNLESVSLFPLEHESDVQLVKSLLNDFVRKTNSQIAKEVCLNWNESQPKFVKVFPYEYQKVLKNLEIKQGYSEESESVNEITKVKEKQKEPAIKDIEETLKNNSSEQPLDKIRGFIKYKRDLNIYRKASERQEDWDEVYNFQYIRKHLKTQAARCMECGVPFCQSNTHGCPLGNIIPKWNDLVFNNDWQEALRQLLQTNNFPEFTGRVCPAPCEGACVLGISELPVTIKNIECAIIDHAFEQGWMKPEIPKLRTGKRVAIVGSGPSGLAAASQLNRAGHFVTVFERNDRPGGLLQYGIPTMKLSKAVVKRRIALMADEGIEFRINAYVGRDIKASVLLEQYDALLLTTGSTSPRDLNLNNRDLNGIHFAMEFLESQQKKQLGGKNDIICAKDKHVIIIGGGDTGCDCMATALRQGAKSITTFEILPEPPKNRGNDNPWPQWPKVFRVDYGHEEVRVKFGNDPRQYCTTTKELIEENGTVTALKTIQVEWNKQPNGQWSMSEVKGSEKYYPADLVLLAMGFLGPEKSLPTEIGLELDARGNIKSTNGSFGTSNPKVFAAGDCRRGQSLVVWAITEGRQAARQIDTYLMNVPSSLPGPGGIIDITRNV
ncbi:glutamate synthase [NADH], amyloplastic-like isoform X2 [Rhagoletis pomonella]|uniref:glutamate synthase [NADH], amyloplastic-like isoform X2 n=1 Tax=Rhagoletis pomonella TaxID=28610 RepID=UPI0017842D2D|nr:glutamate synthase [NADH], amyloplastic-like isoform X2 [Rhagoletis pomonella]